MGPARPINVELSVIWEVLAGKGYNNTNPSYDKRYLTAIRTLGGSGELTLSQRQPIILEENSLIILESPKIVRYRCSGEFWEFWWFVFLPDGPLPYALNSLYRIKANSRDTGDFRQAFSNLQHHSGRVRCIASALFATMLHRWLAESTTQNERTPHRQIVEKMIEHIHGNVADNWTGPRLARESGLSESTFRMAFKLATGMSPARFIRNARLQAASQMIRQGSYSLAFIAEQLNFSSAFHLSAAFKKQFGVPPSAY